MALARQNVPGFSPQNWVRSNKGTLDIDSMTLDRENWMDIVLTGNEVWPDLARQCWVVVDIEVTGAHVLPLHTNFVGVVEIVVADNEDGAPRVNG